MKNSFKILIENFRIFKNTQEFDIKPLTILTGPNNSGKSSLIKFILLLKDNFEKGNKVFNYDNELHNLSSAELVLNDPTKPIKFRIQLNDDLFQDFELKNGDTLVNEFLLTNKKGEIIFKQHYTQIQMNLKLFQKHISTFPILLNSIKKYCYENENVNIDYDFKDYYELPEGWNTYFNGEYYDFCIGEKGIALFFYKVFDFNEMNIDRTPDSNSSEHRRTLLEDLYYNFGHDKFIDYHYLSSIKGFQKRSFSQSDSEELKRILKNLTSKSLHPTLHYFIVHWLNKFEIGEGFEMVYDKVKGIYFFNVDGKSFLEFGFGFTQIITILLKVCEVLTKYELYLIHYNKYSKTRGALVEMRMHMCPIYDVIILEEPETNLHPNYQSLLAELIAECRNHFGLNFIIETHSEYFIRKLQYLVAKKELKPEQIKIYYFNKPNLKLPKGEKQIRTLDIREDGMMDGDFGPGFFDESSMLTMDLLRLQKLN